MCILRLFLSILWYNYCSSDDDLSDEYLPSVPSPHLSSRLHDVLLRRNTMIRKKDQFSGKSKSNGDTVRRQMKEG
ncbi:hypothetical protein PRIPAC_96962 [Pristionchus pacificus]|uniref:Uncharacterized protein n=1 Tax=Pristionchus pacificus TaxID=54126 RepID=A0A2A6BDL3_PRIPA|nr:hypothetical protein PRIPAC_96962 [Pristionchus pacificus]|eukprot:PDM63948.1 hypothetical protein PRIPAC_49449 [Pristionchus pacificus]